MTAIVQVTAVACGAAGPLDAQRDGTERGNGRDPRPSRYCVAVPEMDRRRMMFTMGLGMAAVALPAGVANAQPVGETPPAPGAPIPPAADVGPAFVFSDEFNGAAGSPPNPASWH